MKQTPLRQTGSLSQSTPLKSGGRIRSEGVFTMEYREWRDTIARPYLEQNFPRTCAQGCGERNWLDIGHIKARSTHADLRMELDNIEWQCVPFNRFGACSV